MSYACVDVEFVQNVSWKALRAETILKIYA
jgi:hypothetical protein